jgi:hypothetical protein
MLCKLGIFLGIHLIKSNSDFNYDWLKSFLDWNFNGLYWLDEEDCIIGYVWGKPKFWIQVIQKSKDVELPKRAGIGRPVGSGRVDHIIAGMKKEIKENIKNGYLSARQVSKMFDVSFPTAQKIIGKIKEG